MNRVRVGFGGVQGELRVFVTYFTTNTFRYYFLPELHASTNQVWTILLWKP